MIIYSLILNLHIFFLHIIIIFLQYIIVNVATIFLKVSKPFFHARLRSFIIVKKFVFQVFSLILSKAGENTGYINCIDG